MAGTTPDATGTSSTTGDLRRWRRRPSLQAYLLGLAALYGVLGFAGSAYLQDRNLAEALDDARERATYRAELAAGEIAEALDASRAQVAQLAGNPALRTLFTAPGAQGCTLSFAGAGPFSEGHLDVVDRNGTVLCSSHTAPGTPSHAGEGWLDDRPGEPAILGPLDDPASGQRSLLVIAPLDDVGFVVGFLALDPVPEQLTAVFGQQLSTTFALVDARQRALTILREDQDLIVGEAPVEALGWTVRAAVDRHEALAQAEDVNDRLLAFVIGGLVVVLISIQLVYRAIARPLERLSAAVRSASGDDLATAAASGPAEVLELAEEFTARDRAVKAELAQRRAAEHEARASEASYRTLFEGNPQPMWVHHRHTRALLAVNEAMVRRFGRSREELLATRVDELFVDGTASPIFDELAAQHRVERSGPWRLRGSGDEVIDCEITSDVLQLGGHPGRLVVAEDVTAELRAQRLLQQAQRMESLGQLAGGIAHDFNNVLAAMMNYADFAAEELTAAADTDPARWEPVLRDVEQIGIAGRRAADLTHQLLAFARGEAAGVEPIDLGSVAETLEPMLTRTLGEQVHLQLDLARDLWPISGNVGQLEQVLVNLTVNARDAMPRGGRLSIDAQNVSVDEHHAAERPELSPGRYVRLRVSDTGSGMDAATRDRAFEPFFTTKHPGSGTGLGLATVYGIVTRSGGTIHIYSEVGLGTTVSVLFPATESGAPSSQAPDRVRKSGGGELILVVEDDDNLREIALRILRNGGYEVLAAADGPEALALAAGRQDQIDLLLTDVVMPKMPGIELALLMRATHPGLRLLFMSGYAPPVLTGGALPHGAPLIDKPFSADLLLDRVREALDSAPNDILRGAAS